MNDLARTNYNFMDCNQSGDTSKRVQTGNWAILTKVKPGQRIPLPEPVVTWRKVALVWLLFASLTAAFAYNAYLDGALFAPAHAEFGTDAQRGYSGSGSTAGSNTGGSVVVNGGYWSSGKFIHAGGNSGGCASCHSGGSSGEGGGD
jgi:hypothetical protein